MENFPLFPTYCGITTRTDRKSLTRLKDKGAYKSYSELLKIHFELLREDFYCALAEQVRSIRCDPSVLESTDCYIVKGCEVRYRSLGNDCYQKTVGVEFRFDPKKYAEVEEWHDEKRLMRNNLVLLTQDNLETYHVGMIVESRQDMLLKGQVVVAVIVGFQSNGYPNLDEQERFLDKQFHMVESEAFHFPYIQVTKRLHSEFILADFLNDTTFRLYAPNALSGVCGMEMDDFYFKNEIVHGNLPSRSPKYLHDARTSNLLRNLRRTFRPYVNNSQALALKKILQYRVALVQGPPGTGKTFLGAKAAHLFVAAKRQYPTVFPGPILVFSASNHAVQEFLIRCRDFSDKVVHACSNLHERERVDYGPLQKEHDDARHFDKAAVLKRAEVVGMTTTRAACIRDSLDSMSIKIVIVEEAAEVLEAHVLACIPKRAEHLVMIGDHRQLRPSFAHQDLGKDYNLGLSLFERMVNNGADCPMLNEQRRMRPSIACLVRSVYPNLTDHSSTEGRPRVDGVDLDEPVFFIEHGNEEKEEGKGYKNEEEAKIAVELANYLVLQKNAVGEITILTTYRRQLILIKKLLAEHVNKELQSLRATTVDSFQGEENTIIILSLVRCNPSGKIGFLRMANRACVALSRARNGFFMLGNLFCLTASQEPVWTHVLNTLREKCRVGQVLPLRCLHGVKAALRRAADVRAALEQCHLCQRQAKAASLSKTLEGLTLTDD